MGHRRQTSCVNGHEFTQENTYVDKRGWRKCRACTLYSNKLWDVYKGNGRASRKSMLRRAKIYRYPATGKRT